MSENTMLDLAREIMIGFGEYCGMEITAIDGKELYARMPLRPEFLNVHGFAHGGAVNTLMDTSAGILATFANVPPRRVVTRSARTPRDTTTLAHPSSVRPGPPPPSPSGIPP